MKIFFLLISMFFSFLLNGQKEKIRVISGQTELNQLRTKFKNNQFFPHSIEKNNTIFDRYVQGNKKLIDSIDLILKSNNIELKKSLIYCMSDKPNDFIFDNEIQTVLLNNLVCDETDLIWLIGRKKFQGFIEYFEKKLPDFSIGCQEDMLYWMGDEGNSEVGFFYLKEILLSNEINYDEYFHLQDALYNYMKSRNENIRDMAIDLAIEVYSSKVIYNFLLRYNEDSAKQFESRLLFHIFTLIDKRAVPLAKSLYEQKMHEELALKALVLNNPEEYKNELIYRINTDKNHEYLGCNVSYYYLKASSDISIIPLVVEKYYKNRPHDFVRSCILHNLQDKMEKFLSIIEDKSFVEKVKEEIEIRNKTARDATLDLYNLGVIKAIDTLKYAQKIRDFQRMNEIYYMNKNSKPEPYIYILNQSPISTSYGWESDEFPILYEAIFHYALQLSEFELGRATVYSTSTINGDHSKATHEIFVDFGEIGMYSVHISTSLYPDPNFITEFLNKIPPKINTKKKFFINFIAESNIIFYTDEVIYNNFSDYLIKAFRY